MNDIPDELEETEEQRIRETSALGEKHYFQGVELKEYGLRQQFAFSRVKAVSGSVEFSLLHIFILTLDKKELNSFTRSQEGAEELEDAMIEWGAAHGIADVKIQRADGSVGYNDATEALLRVSEEIFREKAASDFTVKGPKGPENPNA